jgi:CubicO group peptidase (beta-lactamase class C family)
MSRSTPDPSNPSSPAARLAVRAAALATLLLPAAAHAQSQGAPSAVPSAPGLEQVVAGYVAARGFSGVVLVARGDSVLLERAYGQADRAFGVPNRPDTRFEIASVSKTFVAAAVLRLAADGRVDLQAPVARYLPDLPAPDSGAAWAGRVTVHQLLTHTAGLPREHGFRWWETPTMDEQVKRVARLALVAEPGAGYQYSNPGYVLLGGLVERVAGMPYERFVQTRLLDPAGLRDTGFFRGRRVVPRAATGYKVGREGIEATPRARHLGIYAPGGMYSTARDLYRFSRALEGGTLLPSALAARLFAVHATEGSPAEQVGYGWQLRERGGRRYRLASGSAQGSKSTVMREPSTGLGVVVLANSGDTPILEILRDLTGAAEGRPVSPPAPCRPPAAAALAAYPGDYDFSASPLARVMSAPGLVMTILRAEGRLYLYDAGEDTASLLCARGDGSLGLSFTGEMRLRLAPAAGGAPPHLLVEWGGAGYRGPRVR